MRKENYTKKSTIWSRIALFEKKKKQKLRYLIAPVIFLSFGLFIDYVGSLSLVNQGL